MAWIDVILVFIGLVFLYLIAELFNFEYEVIEFKKQLTRGKRIPYEGDRVIVVDYFDKYLKIRRFNHSDYETVHIYEFIQADSLIKKLWKKLRKI